jgi:hypothetical protein
LFPDNKHHSFVVKDNDGTLMKVQMRPAKKHVPKHIEMLTFGKNGEYNRFTNVKPVRIRGKWRLCLGGRPGIPSIKNCVFVREENGRDRAMIMRRVSSTVCEIDGDSRIPTVCLFAYGISAFISDI